MARLLEVSGLHVEFPVTGGGLLRRSAGRVQAVSGIDLTLAAGETLGVVGESGCGKTSTGRAILQLNRPTRGSVVFDGRELTSLSARALRPIRREMQIVFQNPYGSLDPRLTVNDIVAEPFQIHGRWDSAGPGSSASKVAELLHQVGLNPEHGNRYPHEFSGGQRQRIGIARAIALEPRLLVLDEPVSALDVSVQAGIINLLEELQDRLGLAYLFIAHDLSVVRHISDRIAVMYLGKIVETGPRDAVYEAPMHPYTQALLSAAPVADTALEARRERIVLTGEIPSPLDPPSGCRFRTRCWLAQEICAAQEPPLLQHGSDENHLTACHFATLREIV